MIAPDGTNIFAAVKALIAEVLRPCTPTSRPTARGTVLADLAGMMTAPHASSSFARIQRIFIIDDLPIVRFGIAQLLGSEPDLEICGEAEHSREATEKLRVIDPDLVLLDLSLGSESGIDLLHQLKARWPALRVLIVSTHDERLHGEQAIRAGACGYLQKAAPPAQFVIAVRTALQGAMVISEALAAALSAPVESGPRESASPLAGLSDRELEIFALIARGCHTRAIAEALCIGVKTVESHQFNLRKKLNAGSTHDLRHLAYTWANSRGDANTGSPTCS